MNHQVRVHNERDSHQSFISNYLFLFTKYLLRIQMPRTNKRRSHSRSFLTKRHSSSNWSEPKSLSSSSSEEEQIDYTKDSDESFDFTNQTMLDNIGDLFALCKEEYGSKNMSVLIYMVLRHFNLSWRDTEEFLKNIGAMSIVSCHKWSKVFLDEDLDAFVEDGRGGRRGSVFWDCYPELEISAREFSIGACSRKASSFTVQELAEFVTNEFYELYDFKKVDDTSIRSVQSLRLDLKRWGIHYSSNKLRPYFLGHERIDVVDHRKKIVDYFIQNENNYYRISDGDNPAWIAPSESNPTVLLCKCISVVFSFIKRTRFSLIFKAMMNRRSGAMRSATSAGSMKTTRHFLKKEREGLSWSQTS